MSEPIILERPACPTCDATLTGRQFYRVSDDGSMMVMYANGETIQPDNFIEVTVCPRCDR